MGRAIRQPMLLVPETESVAITENWRIVKDGDAVTRLLYCRHYSSYEYKDGRDPKLFVGPGEKIVLVTANGDAAFAWRKYKDDYLKDLSVWCSFFRNEGPILSSALIAEAIRVAECKWPSEPLYTMVNPSAIKSKNPGYCFKFAGFELYGETSKGLHVLRYTRRGSLI